MSKYPKISDEIFYKKINILFSKFKIKKNKQTLDEICYPNNFKLQLPQQFVSNFINNDTPYKSLLLFHQIGAGKTCASIRIAENFKNKKNILIVTPASLIENYYYELRGQCTNGQYVTSDELNELDKLDFSSKNYKNLIKKINKKIDKYYSILSYNKFVEKIQKNKLSLDDTILIIDEVQNIISEKGKNYSLIYKFISKSWKNYRIILLSGTPIFNHPYEIALIFNLLKPKNELPNKSDFIDTFLSLERNDLNEINYIPKNLELFKKYFKGYVSFYRGASPVSFPRKNIYIVECIMSDYQYKSYKSVESDEGPFRTGDILNLPNNFFIGTRIISNISFPKKEINENGYNKFIKDNLELDKLKMYSIKFYKILKKIKKSKGTIFIYSNFKEYGGLKSLIKVLEYHKYKSYKKYGKGINRYALWTGDESSELKKEIKDVFNDENNVAGDYLKIILGSPAMKEGISLLRIEQIHILEPYWNWSRLEQIIGRGVRFCSHKDLIKTDRYVDIFIYISVHPNEDVTIDKYILDMAYRKYKIINKFEILLKESSVDCKLNYNGNVYNSKEKINCYNN